MDRQIIEEIRNKIDLREWALQLPKARRSGSRVMAICPWHDDTDPSLAVSEQGFYCFGCHKGGDVFNWLMLREGCSFPEALERAAKAAGIALDQKTNKQLRQALRHRAQLNDQITKAQELLWSERGEKAREYLYSRGIEDSTIIEFRLGYEVKRNAIVLPMVDIRGEVLAYSLRFLGNGGKGKYWHKGTPSFKYSHHLYNEASLWLFNGDVFLAEGPFDVMKLHQAGCKRAVGILGGLLSETQIQRLGEHAERLILVPDVGSPEDWKKLQRNVQALRTAFPNLELLVAKPPAEDAGASDTEALAKAMLVRQAPEMVLLDLVLQGEPAEQYEQARAYLKEINNPLLRNDIIKELAQRWQKPVSLVEQSLVYSKAQIVAAAATIGDSIEALVERTRFVNDSQIKLWLPGLERATEVIQPGHVVGIGADPGVGKTMLVLNCIRKMAHLDCLQVFFSMEQPKAEIALRLMMMESWANNRPVDYRTMNRLLLERGPEYEGLRSLTEARLKRLRIVSERLTIEEMRATLQTIARLSDLPIGVIWLDYLGLIKAETKGSLYEQVTEVANAIPPLAHEFNAIFCEIIQLSRAQKGETNRRPKLNDFRDSGAIEQSLDLAIGISVEDTDETGLIQTLRAEVLKNRHGPILDTVWVFRRDRLAICEREKMFSQGT